MSTHSRDERDLSAVVDRLRGGLVVSCQAEPGHPLHGPANMATLARCAELGSAVAVRVEGADDVRAAAAAIDVPVVGIVKVPTRAGRPYITPTFADCETLVRAGAGIVAVEATHDYRRDPGEFADLCARVHAELRAPVMADVSTLVEGIEAWRGGADLVATTLSGYTTGSAGRIGPDLDLVAELASSGVRTVLEGQVRHPEQVADAFAAGAWAVVIGTAITAPDEITRWFAAATPRANGAAGERHPSSWVSGRRRANRPRPSG